METKVSWEEPKQRLMEFLQWLIELLQPSLEAKDSLMELRQRRVETEELLREVGQRRKETNLRQKDSLHYCAVARWRGASDYYPIPSWLAKRTF